MARARFFRNPLKWLTEKLAPPPPEPPREPPRPPVEYSEPESGPPQNFYRQIWNQEVSRSHTRRVADRTGYSRQEQFQLHVELFLSMFFADMPRDEQETGWHDYLDTFVTGQTRHATFFEEWGLDPRDFDWEAWRSAEGYSRRGK